MKKTFIPGMPCVGVFPDIEGNGGSPGTGATAEQKTHFRGRDKRVRKRCPACCRCAVPSDGKSRFFPETALKTA